MDQVPPPTASFPPPHQSEPGWKQVAAWALRGILALLILLWAYDGLVEPDLLLRGLMAVTVLAGILLLVIVIQMGPGLQRVLLANAAGFVVFGCNVAYIAIKSQGPISLFAVTLAAGLIAVPWAVRFSGGVRRLMAGPPPQQQPVRVLSAEPEPGATAEEPAAPTPAPGSVAVVKRRERPRYTLPAQRPPAKRRPSRPKAG